MTNDKLDLALASFPAWQCAQVAGQPTIERKITQGLSNESYLLRWGNQRFLLRLFSPGPTHFAGVAAEIEISQQAHLAGIAPKQIFASLEQQFVVCDYVDGFHWNSAQANDPNNVQRLAQVLKKIHLLPSGDRELVLPKVIENYHQRLQGTEFESLVQGEWQLQLLATAKELRASLDHIVLCHNDLVLGNIIDTGDQLYIIDWEYAALCDPMNEIAVIALNHQLGADQIQLLLLSYFGDLNQALRERFESSYQVASYVDLLWYAAQSVQLGDVTLGNLARSKFETLARIVDSS